MSWNSATDMSKIKQETKKPSFNSGIKALGKRVLKCICTGMTFRRTMNAKTHSNRPI